MKNKLLIISYFLFTYLISISANAFKFETKKLEILNEGDVIIAEKGTVFSEDNDLIIKANNFKFQKKKNILDAFGNGEAVIKSKNLIINFDHLFYDRKNLIIIAKGKVIFNKVDNQIIINSKNIYFDKLKNYISSDNSTFIKDKFNNEYSVDKFKLDINTNILKVINLDLKDANNNKLKTELAYVNTKTGKIFGKDASIYFDSTSFNEKNEPRLKGKSFEINKNFVHLNKGIFTTCQKRDGCPPWTLQSKKIIHDKKKKKINYEHTLLKLYDIPVLYFPKFFHPDPTVNRQSGFLTPSFNTSNNNDNYLNTPFFLVLSENRDITVSPRFYNNNEMFLVQSEFRHVGQSSQHVFDTSYFLEKNKNSKNHYFYKYSKKLDVDHFQDSSFDLNIQKTSNDTYLKKSNIDNIITDNYDMLKNSAGLNFYSNNLSVDVSTSIYEDLNKSNNDRYEYILPRINLIKRLNNEKIDNGTFTLKSKSYIRNFDTNIYEKKNLNQLIFSSYPVTTSSGFLNQYRYVLKNNISSNKKSTYKNNDNMYLSSIFQFNSSLPLIKKDSKFEKILKPKIALNIAPPHTKDNRNLNTKIDTNNIFLLDRVEEETTEGGISLAYGSNYSISNSNNSEEIFNYQFSNNLRLKNNDDLTNNNQIGEKTSNFFNQLTFRPNENIKTSYKNAIKNNLKDIEYEDFNIELSFNKIITKFNYINENFNQDKNSYIENETMLKINEKNSFLFMSRKNKEKNLNEFYNLMYQYKIDCLSASIEYNKEYYNDRDINPKENIFLKLTFIPLGELSSPNINE